MKLTATGHRRGLVGGALALAVVVCSTSTAQAIPLFKFVGIVTDALNRPLAGVKVTDSTNDPVYTTADGHYALEESSLTTYTLRASRADTLARDSERQTVTLPLDRTVDFTPPAKHLLYKLQTVPSPSTISTATTAATVTLAITSWAPQPASTCVNVRDTRTGTVAAATYLQMIDSVRSSWRYTLSVPQMATEGSFSLLTEVTDCASGTVLTSPTSGVATYLVDNTPPRIEEVVPADLDNTAYLNQPLFAHITDARSGVKPSTIVFTLTDTATGTTTTYSGSAVSYQSSTGIASSSPAPLVAGHSYDMTVNVSDWATNPSAPESATFLATTFTVNTTQASIPATSCTVSDTIGTDGMRAVSCPDVPLHLDATSVSLSGSRHAGAGAVVQTAALDAAYLSMNVGGVDINWPAPQSNDAAWAPKTQNMRFEVAGGITGGSIPVPQHNLVIGQLNSKVPAAWTAPTVTLRMPRSTTIADSPTCDRPVTNKPCSPDPVAVVAYNGWNPGIPDSHVGPCDTALTHKPLLARTPNTATSFTVDVDTGRFTPSTMSFTYDTGSGPIVQTVSGTGASQYSFTVPATALPNGTIIRYAFSATGTFGDSKCSGVVAAAAPSNFAFEAAAVTQPASHPPALNKARTDALGMALRQPTYLTGPQPQLSAVCGNSFASPTPCDLYSALQPYEEAVENPELLSPMPATTRDSGPIGDEITDDPVEGCITSSDGRTLTMTHGAGARQAFMGKSLKGASLISADKVDQDIPPGALSYTAVQQVIDIGGSMWSGWSDGSGTVWSGRALWFTGGWEPTRVKLTMPWLIQGHQQAFAGPAEPFAASGASASASAAVSYGVWERNHNRRGQPDEILTRPLGKVWDGPNLSANYSGSTIFAFKGVDKKNDPYHWDTLTTEITIEDNHEYYFYVALDASASISYSWTSGATAESNFLHDVNRWWLEAGDLTWTMLESGRQFGQGCVQAFPPPIWT